MDRQIVYIGALPQDTDLLLAQKNTMVGLGYLAQALFGTSAIVDGLACTPTSPASLAVKIGPGSLYQVQNVDNSAYGSLAADTTDQVVKQAILLAPATQLSTPAPATAGQSINYLIQAAFSETDTGSATLPYYNAANPAQAWAGPNNTGTSQNTKRQCSITLQAKAGGAAATGSQVTPAPDAGFVGLWVVTVANGQANVAAGNISAYANAPIIAGAAKANGRLINIQTFGANATYTPTPGTRLILVEVQGGGGAAGGQVATSTGQDSIGGGGGGGGYARKLITNPSAQTVTIGAGGTGVAGGTGNSGGTTSFGAILSATGGAGGAAGLAGTAANAVGGTGGTGSGGDVNETGRTGDTSWYIANQAYISGLGGEGQFLQYGRGGNGALSGANAAAVAGAAGGAGFCVVWEFG